MDAEQPTARPPKPKASKKKAPSVAASETTAAATGCNTDKNNTAPQQKELSKADGAPASKVRPPSATASRPSAGGAEVPKATVKAPPKGGLTEDPVLPSSRAKVKPKEAVSKDWYGDLNSFLDEEERNPKPKREKPSHGATEAKQQSKDAKHKSAAEPGPAQDDEYQDDCEEVPVDEHDDPVVLYGYKPGQPQDAAAAKVKQRKRSKHKPEPDEQPEELKQPEPEPEPEPEPAPVDKKTLKVVLKVLDGIIQEAVRKAEVRRVMREAGLEDSEGDAEEEEEEDDPDKCVLEGDDWQNAARLHAGQVGDGGLAGLVAGVHLPRPGMRRDEDMPLTAPVAEDDFKLLQQNLGPKGPQHAPASSRDRAGEGVTPPGMSRYALRNLGIVS